MNTKVLSIFLCILFPLFSIAASATELVFFRRHGCSHCARLENFLEGELLPRYPELEVRYFEVDEPEAQEVLAKLLRAYGIELKLEELYTPLIFVGDYAFIATGGLAGGLRVYGMEPEPFEAAGPAEELVLEDAVGRAIEARAPSPLSRIAESEGAGLAEALTIPALVVAAAADSVNPCTFAVLILLLGTLLVAGRRGKVIWVGLSFVAAIYISYFLMGLGIFTAIQSAGVQRPFVLAVSSLAILLGLWNMKDYFAYGKWFTIEVPQRWRPIVKKLTSSAVTIPGAFAVGVLDSFFLLPCSSGPYIAILALLQGVGVSRLLGILYLLLYNFIFIIPLLVITLGIHFGFTTTARAERWRSARLGTLHFVAGAVMFLLGAGMIVALQFGYL
ncbi:cytochrome c biogenesis protein CcdA [Candidatus Bipolaricaulota sp. J31]